MNKPEDVTTENIRTDFKKRALLVDIHVNGKYRTTVEIPFSALVKAFEKAGYGIEIGSVNLRDIQ
jgi:hypothetical protein